MYMRLLFFLLLLLSFSFSGFADVIGKRRNADCSIALTNITALKGYLIYWHGHGLAYPIVLQKDTTVILRGSRGRPFSGWCWAVRNGQNTDTITFTNYYSPDIVVKFTGVENNKLKVVTKKRSNKNKKVKEGAGIGAWLSGMGNGNNTGLMMVAALSLLLLTALAVQRKKLRMLKPALAILLVLFCSGVKADTPDKKRMYDSKVTLHNIGVLAKEYRFYIRSSDTDSTAELRSDTAIVIPSSGGAPRNFLFWAVSKKTNVNTDTLEYHNYYDPDYDVSVDSVVAGKLKTTMRESANRNSGDEGLKSGDVIPDEAQAAGGLSVRSKWLIGLAVAALLGLIGWLVWRRKKERNS
jgi:hypothetical protein